MIDNEVSIFSFTHRYFLPDMCSTNCFGFTITTPNYHTHPQPSRLDAYWPTASGVWAYSLVEIPWKAFIQNYWSGFLRPKFYGFFQLCNWAASCSFVHLPYASLLTGHWGLDFMERLSQNPRDGFFSFERLWLYLDQQLCNVMVILPSVPYGLAHGSNSWAE